MSEHDFDFTPLKWDDYVHACQRASTSKCIIIPGIEYSSPDDDIHVVTIGTPLFHGARRNLLDTIPAVHEEGGAAVLAHPRRRDAFKKITGNLLNVLDGIEIWNRKVDGLLPVEAYFNFARNRELAQIVAMDLHTWRQVFPMWNEISGGLEPLDGKAIATALRERRTVPACVLGKLGPGLDEASSVALNLLGTAELFRRLLRDIRGALRPQ
jgi:hypothetical protein